MTQEALARPLLPSLSWAHLPAVLVIPEPSAAFFARLSLTSPLGNLPPGDHLALLRITRDPLPLPFAPHYLTIRIPSCLHGPQDFSLRTSFLRLPRPTTGPMSAPYAATSSSMRAVPVEHSSLPVEQIPPSKVAFTLFLKKRPLGLISAETLLGPGRDITFSPENHGADLPASLSSCAIPLQRSALALT